MIMHGLHMMHAIGKSQLQLLLISQIYTLRYITSRSLASFSATYQISLPNLRGKIDVGTAVTFGWVHLEFFIWCASLITCAHPLKRVAITQPVLNNTQEGLSCHKAELVDFVVANSCLQSHLISQTTQMQDHLTIVYSLSPEASSICDNFINFPPIQNFKH